MNFKLSSSRKTDLKDALEHGAQVYLDAQINSNHSYKCKDWKKLGKTVLSRAFSDDNQNSQDFSSSVQSAPSGSQIAVTGAVDTTTSESLYLTAIQSTTPATVDSSAQNQNTSSSTVAITTGQIEFSWLIFCRDSHGQWLKIGAGGFADVYKAVLNGEDVAVKVQTNSGQPANDSDSSSSNSGASIHAITATTIDSPVDNPYQQTVAQNSQNREAYVNKKLTHENIIRCLGDGKDTIGEFIVFEYCNGGNLRDHFKKWRKPEEQFTAALLFRYLLHIMYGLRHLHRQEICHLDLKPENILLKTNPAGENTLKLCDFGVSADNTDYSKTLRTHAGFGTVGYMAPEILARKQATTDTFKKADTFAFAMVVLDLVLLRYDLTKHPIFPREYSRDPHGMAVLYGDIIGNALRTSLPVDLPLAMKCLVSLCWHQDPTKRTLDRGIISFLESMERDDAFTTSMDEWYGKSNGECKQEKALKTLKTRGPILTKAMSVEEILNEIIGCVNSSNKRRSDLRFVSKMMENDLFFSVADGGIWSDANRAFAECARRVNELENAATT